MCRRCGGDHECVHSRFDHGGRRLHGPRAELDCEPLGAAGLGVRKGQRCDPFELDQRPCVEGADAADAHHADV
jgi:hypothetical protein